MPLTPQISSHRWSTAATARIAAIQCALCAVLAVISGYAVMVAPDPSWWWGLGVWTVGVLAAGSTWVHHIRGASRTTMPFSSWATPLLICSLTTVGALAVLVTTHSPIALVVMLAALFGAVGILARSSI